LAGVSPDIPSEEFRALPRPLAGLVGKGRRREGKGKERKERGEKGKQRERKHKENGK